VKECTDKKRVCWTASFVCAVIFGVLGGLLPNQIVQAAGYYRNVAPDGSVSFSDAPGGSSRTAYRTDFGRPTAQSSCRGLTTKAVIKRGETFKFLLHQAARNAGVDANLLMAMARAESCFDPKAVSRAGAEGMLQLMPATARELGVTNSFDVKQNINGGARYLAKMMKRFDGNQRFAIAAYNAGPGAVAKYNGVPPYKETIKYLKRVNQFYRGYTTAAN